MQQLLEIGLLHEKFVFLEFVERVLHLNKEQWPNIYLKEFSLDIKEGIVSINKGITNLEVFLFLCYKTPNY